MCLVDPTCRRDRMILPGGTVEANEAPRDGCGREVHEELGVHLAIGRLLTMRWVPPALPADEHGSMILVYDGGVVDADTIRQFVVPPDELYGFAFIAPDDLDRVTPNGNADRIRGGLEALATNELVEF